MEYLAYTLLGGIQLHVTVDTAGSTLGDADQKAPFLVAAEAVPDDLRRRPEVCVAVENLLWGGVAFDGPVVDASTGDENNGVGRGPAPKQDRFRHLVALHFGAQFHAEDLQL